MRRCSLLLSLFFVFGLILVMTEISIGFDGSSEQINQDLRNGKILIDRPDGVQVHEIGARAMGVVAAPIEDVWAAVIDFNNKAEWMPNIEATHIVTDAILKELESQEKWDRKSFQEMVGHYFSDSLYSDTVYVCYDVKMPFPFARRWYLLKIILNHEQYLVKWSMVAGNLNTNHGSWELKPFEDDALKTVVLYTTYSDPGLLLPRSILGVGVAKTLPKVIEGLRNETAHAVRKQD